MLLGGLVTQAIYVAAKLRIADHLGARPVSVHDLGRVVEADPPTLYRVLRALATVDVFVEHPDRHFTLGRLGELLRTDHPNSFRNIALLRGIAETYVVWGELLFSTQTGRSGFERVFDAPRFEYFEQHPDASSVFHATMGGHARAMAPILAATYDFKRFRKLVDVGGGSGNLLGTLLKLHPTLHGVLFDLPSVVAGARPFITELGLDGRIEVVGGDFFEQVPSSDAYITFNTLHDWDNDDARRILQNIARAMDGDGVLLVVDVLVSEEPNQRRLATWFDLSMLTVLGGCERTEAEFRPLVTAAGLRVIRVLPTPSPYFIIECMRS
jgi:hypothetical protein